MWAKLKLRQKRRNAFEHTADFCYYRTEPPPMLDTEDSFDAQLVSKIKYWNHLYIYTKILNFKIDLWQRSKWKFVTD